jgi:hypothetical protein
MFVLKAITYQPKFPKWYKQQPISSTKSSKQSNCLQLHKESNQPSSPNCIESCGGAKIKIALKIIAETKT